MTYPTLPYPIVKGNNKDDLLHDFYNLLQQQKLGQYADYIANSVPIKKSVTAILHHSPYLSDIMNNDTSLIAELCDKGCGAVIEKSFSEMMRALHPDDNIPPPFVESDNSAPLMQYLRRYKKKISFIIAWADLTQEWDLMQITQSLGKLAKLSIQLAYAHIIYQMKNKAYLNDDFCNKFTDANTPDDSGIFIAAMGKLGGGELNYSSDIDLLVFYDPARLPFKENYQDRAQEILNRYVKKFIKLLDEVTIDGYVFRCDLRLRPDPASTSPIMSSLSAEHYYESVGQTWERAALIKACFMAGDKIAHDDFFHIIQPFIWRKNLDYTAMDEIADMRMRMLNYHAGDAKLTQHSDISNLYGLNIKLCLGGIRDIEFLVQSKQLIWGGRKEKIRTKPTIETLENIINEALFDKKIFAPLKNAYYFLRYIEHRLQMIDDKQTQTLPTNSQDMENFVNFAGFENTDSFAQELLNHLLCVQEINASDGPKRQSADQHMEKGNYTESKIPPFILQPNDAKNNEQILSYLQKCGFKDCSHIAQIVQNWFSGSYRAMRNEKGRNALYSILPDIFAACTNTPYADETLLKFNDFLTKIPASAQLFALLKANPNLTTQLFEILGTAPAIGQWLAANPQLFDMLLEMQIGINIFNIDTAHKALSIKMKADDRKLDLEEYLHIIHQWLNDQKFLLRMSYFHLQITIDELTEYESRLAEITLSYAVDIVTNEYHAKLLERKGNDNSNMADITSQLQIIAFGKLGGGELLPLSDLDLVFIYDGNPDDDINGLPAMLYYNRLCQRIITFLTAKLANGILYEIDNRLRPSGISGSIACHNKRFLDYYLKGEAWAWEFMSLIRARNIGDEYKNSGNTAAFLNLKQRIFTALDFGEEMKENILKMWEKTRETHNTTSPWNVKYRAGGLQDVEYIVQYLQLYHTKRQPDILSENTLNALDNLHHHNLISLDEYNDLKKACKLWLTIAATLRLLLPDGATADDGLAHQQYQILCDAVSHNLSLPIMDKGELKQFMEISAKSVTRIFKEYFDIRINNDI